MRNRQRWLIISTALLGMIGFGSIAHQANADTTSVQPATAEQYIPSQSSSAAQPALTQAPKPVQNNNTQSSNSQSSVSNNVPQKITQRAATLHSQILRQSAHVAPRISAQPKAGNVTAPQMMNHNNHVTGHFIGNNIDLAQKFTHGKAGWHAYLSNNGTILTVTGDFTNYKPIYQRNSNVIGGAENWFPNEEYSPHTGLLGTTVSDDTIDKYLGNVHILRLGNTTNLKSIQAMFCGMPDLWSVVKVGNFDTTYVNDMADAFRSDMSLTQLEALKYWNTSNVTDMQDMFQSDTDLGDLSPLSDWDTSRVQEMNNMFANQSDISDVYLTDLTPFAHWDTSNVLSMGGMFMNDTGITSIKPLSDWDTSSTYAMADMFKGDNKIQPSSSWLIHHAAHGWNDSTLDKTIRTNMNPQNRKYVTDTVKSDEGAGTVEGLNGSNGQQTEPNGIVTHFVFNNGANHDVRAQENSIPNHPKDEWQPNPDPVPVTHSKPAHKGLQPMHHGGPTPATATTGDSDSDTGEKAPANNNQNNTTNTKPSQDRQPANQPAQQTPQPAYDSKLGLYIDTINYTYNGKIIGTSEVAGGKGQSFKIGANPNNLQTQYKTVDPQTSLEYDGFSHTVPVELNEAAPVTLSLSNQNNVTVGYATLKNLGLVGQKVNIEPYLVHMMPKGYHLPSNQPIYITLSNGSSIIINA